MRRRTASHVARQLTDLSIVAPEVIARRVALIASAGGVLTANDHRELSRMSLEKWEAAWLAWVAIGTVGLTLWIRVATSWTTWLPAANQTPTLKGYERVLGQLVTAGLTPYVRIAKANRRRLAPKVTSTSR